MGRESMHPWGDSGYELGGYHLGSFCHFKRAETGSSTTTCLNVLHDPDRLKLRLMVLIIWTIRIFPVCPSEADA